MATTLEKPVLAKAKCSRCAGTGQQVDDFKTGRAMQHLRVKAGLKQTDIATALGISGGYISDLELGKRNWDTALIEGYLKALR